MLWKAAMDYIRLADFLLSIGPENYQIFKNATLEYVRNCEAVIINFSFEDTRPASSPRQ